MLFIITGVGRSGTTLLSMMLNAHSNLSIPYESNFFVDLYQRRNDFGDLTQRDNQLSLANTLLQQFRVKRWEHELRIEDLQLARCDSVANAIDELYRAYAEKDGKNQWGDKTPGYIESIDQLWEIFPAVKIIHLYRDGRDVALSQLATGWWSMNDLMTTLVEWRKKVENARHMLQKKPSQYWMEVQYETFVADPEPVLKQICDFLNIPFERQMLQSYHQAATQKLTASSLSEEHKNLLHAPSTKRCYKWKTQLSELDQALAYKNAGQLLQQLGYESGVQHQGKLAMMLRRCYHYATNWKYRIKRLPFRLLNRKQPYLYRRT